VIATIPIGQAPQAVNYRGERAQGGRARRIRRTVSIRRFSAAGRHASQISLSFLGTSMPIWAPPSAPF
jgi:acyl-[acyl carrier protein]--UDP-N-acetylglucosamine O-acyltransferase